VQGASRTEAGVHAVGQVAHIEFDAPRRVWDFVRALNALTDDDVCVVRAEEVSPDFHARHSARGKRYRYRMWNHRFAHPLELERTWHVRSRLDVDLMRQAAAKLVGEHDFSAFRASDCESATTVRELTRVELDVDGPMLTLWVEGTAFLKYMVRIISGTLVDVGRGQLTLADVDDLLSGKAVRAEGGQTAVPYGLTLMEIFYPDFPWSEPVPHLGGAPMPEGLR